MSEVIDFKAGYVLGFDKPYRRTSFYLVSRVRWLLSRKTGMKRLKVGHAGTLDPLATGVEVICVGKATKRITELQQHTKEYIAGVRLGATTPSFDMEHPEDATFPTDHITEEAVSRVLKSFEGDIMQEPPLFSACNIDGKRAYKLARKGSDVRLKAKPVRIDEIELLEYSPTDLRIRVVCGKGTYIRALARDIGQALGSGAYLTSLRRTKVGDIRVEDCFASYDDFEKWVDTIEIAKDTETQKKPTE